MERGTVYEYLACDRDFRIKPDDFIAVIEISKGSKTNTSSTSPWAF